MKKKAQGKKVKEMKLEEGMEEEEDDDDPTPTRMRLLYAGRGRQDNSLSVLTKKFIELIKSS